MYCEEKVLKLSYVSSLPLLPASHPLAVVNPAVLASVKVAIPVLTTLIKLSDLFCAAKTYKVSSSFQILVHFNLFTSMSIDLKCSRLGFVPILSNQARVSASITGFPIAP